MKHTLLKLLLFTNFVLFIMYMGLTTNAAVQLNTRGIISLLLSSLLLTDITYVSACNIRENKTISLFCGLLALYSWYILLSASRSPVTNTVFSVLSPVIWCVSIKFILMFGFQNSGYRFQKTVNTFLTAACIGTLMGLLISDRLFALLYGIQFFTGWMCFIFIVLYHRKRVAFVFKSEWKRIIFSLTATMILFVIYCFSTVKVPEHLSSFGIYLPVLIFWLSIHGILLKDHSSCPLSAVFSNCQLILLILSGTIICGLIAMTLNGGYPFFFILLDAMFTFLYACNIVLDFNFKQGQNKIIKDSKYHAALGQLQREEQLNLEFADFLHDDILQDLLSIKNMIKKADRPEIQKIITETLDHMNTYIREQMQNYHPALLPKLTIKENYQNLLEDISQTFPRRNISIAFDCGDSLFLVEPYHILVYRLLKELVTNVYKHSTGDKARITLTQEDGMITLSVCDNGSADADSLISADLSRHRGLAMITKRVHDMDGSVMISTLLPHGICVQITLPMKGDVSYQYFVNR